jgi:hypothetical protein
MKFSEPALLQRLTGAHGRLGGAAYAAVLCLVVLALAGAVGILTKLPWLFPSLGPTVMLFFESPEQPAARPINTIVGHGVGIAAGALCLFAFGLQDDQPAPVGGLNPGYVAAAAASVAITTLVLTLLHLPHPPAGASTLIVSLGILTTAPQIAAMVGAVLLVTAVGWGINILLGTTPSKPQQNNQG